MPVTYQNKQYLSISEITSRCASAGGISARNNPSARALGDAELPRSRSTFASDPAADARLEKTMSDPFDTFMKQRAKIAAAYSSGNASPLNTIVAREGTATFFPPTGGSVSGANEVAARYNNDAKARSPGSKSKLDVLQSGASEELAFWTGFQEFQGKIGGQDVNMRLRITELFRRNGDEWRLVHRHADAVADPKPSA
jgi:ketosteroid isomerase-like protein